MHGADARGLRAVSRNGNEFAQSVIADFQIAVVKEDIARLQVTVHDAAVMKVGQPLGNLTHEERSLLHTETVGFRNQQVTQ